MIKDIFNDIISDLVKPLMKESGFKKIGLSFYREYNDLIYLINIQNSNHNNYAVIDFYINCCIHSKQIDENLGVEIKPQPKEYECYYGKRIESITGFNKNRFTINSETDLQELREELKSNLIKAIDYLIQINNLDKLIDLMINQNGLQNFQELLSFLIKTNRMGLAKEHIRRLYSDFNNDSRWPKFEQKINDILVKNKSNLMLNELI
jgi:hypothetical protein